MKFRKKPVVIEATQWFKDGDHPAVRAWDKGGHVYPNGTPLIDTLEGELRVSPGDWIITGVKGEHYPCKPDIFAATYDPADQRPALGAAHPGYSSMQPHQQRVVDEKAELDERLAKLVDFTRTSIFAGLDAEERNRLDQQAATMAMYSDILGDRIAAFASATAA
jgi:hypothetical protein